MKVIFFSVLMTISLYSQAQFVTIPDINFRNKLMQLYPNCFNGLQQMDTTCSDIVNENYLFVNTLVISTIDGVQYFDNLDSLEITNSQVSTVPILQNSIKYLNLELNSISTLPNLPAALEVLKCNNNLLVSLPPLPNTTKEVICYNNQITNLPLLPNSVTILFCEGNQLTSLPVLSDSLVTLLCRYNQLTNLPALPSNLEILICGNNPLNSIPALPSNLQTLNINEANLITFPTLPLSLKELHCGNNHLTDLPTLPPGLTSLNFGGNLITNIQFLPPTLKNLDCQSNLLTYLPSLTDSLMYLHCGFNPQLDCLPLLPPTLTYCNTGGTNITCKPNTVPGLNLILPLCANGSGCEPSPTASGTIFHDNNNNGTFDIGESLLKNWVIDNFPQWSASSNLNGSYQIKLDSGINNTFKCEPAKPYFAITPANYVITPVTGGSQGINYNFAVTVIPNIYDLRIDIAKEVARPGFTQWVGVNVHNQGTENSTNATVKLLLPTGFTFLNANPLIAQQIGDTLIWNNVDVDIFKQKTLSLHLQVPVNAVIGTTYQMQAWVLPSVTDTTPSDNHIIDDGTIQGSFDPNDKTVSKIILNPNAVSEELKYTIRFQNTGTDTAFNIMVRDDLSDLLDFSTFQMTGASHNYTYQIREKGLLEVFFQNVLLPDSNTNEPLSHGYFQYVIKPKATLQLSDSIQNTAAIYFDFNAPIITNTVTSKFIVTGLANHSKIEANLYPNPTTGKAIISIAESKGVFTLSDMNGSMLSKMHIINGSEIDLSRFHNGIYIGKIETEKGIKVLKIVKQD